MKTFAKGDGLISHMKLYGPYIFFVQNMTKVKKLIIDEGDKPIQHVCDAKDTVLAIDVTSNMLRPEDSGLE